MEEFFDWLNQWRKKYFKYVKLLFILMIVIIILRYFTTVLTLFMPFVLAWVLSMLIDPAVKFMQNRLHIPRKLGSLIALILVIALLGSAINVLVKLLIEEANYLSRTFPSIYEKTSSYLTIAGSKLETKFQLLPKEIFTAISDSINNLGSTISSYIMSLVKPIGAGALTAASYVPKILIFIIIMLLSTYFISSDKDRIKTVFKKRTPQSWSKFFVLIKQQMFSALWAWLRAQLIVMSITAVELSVGFIILKIPYAILLGIAISLLDALPILGTGTVLIPWAVVCLTLGDYKMTTGLAVIYLTCLLVRQLVEPKIVSANIGLNPLVTLICIYAGLRLFGFAGMIGLPIAVLIIVKCYKIGMFDWLIERKGESKV